MPAQKIRSRMKLCYRIVDCDDEGRLKTLFHGVGGSRRIEPGVWYAAAHHIVSEGANGTRYISGFHVLKDIPACERYMRKFKKPGRVIVPVMVKGLRPKKHSPSPVFLADAMMVPKQLKLTERT